MDRTHVEYWPAHLQSVFAMVGRSLGEKRLTPDIVGALPAACGAIVAGHQVCVSHVPGKRAGPRTGHYVVAITGPRINARVRLRPFELEKLSRSVARALGRKTEDHRGQYELGAEVW
jgi:hypothetical protein